jgi:hypothetical protein
MLDQGALAQLGERLLCKQDVVGSIPSGSTNLEAGREPELLLFLPAADGTRAPYGAVAKPADAGAGD